MTQDEFLKVKYDVTPKGISLFGSNVMSHAEKGFMQKSVLEICKRVKPKVVLEVGYGLGYSADAFDEYGLEKHYIVEPHPEILALANEKRRILIKDFIQNVTLNEPIDLIYDDIRDYTGQPFTLTPKDYERFRYRWWAKRPEEIGVIQHSQLSGFVFALGKKKYFQPLVKNKIYFAFYGNDS